MHSKRIVSPGWGGWVKALISVSVNGRSGDVRGPVGHQLTAAVE